MHYRRLFHHQLISVRPQSAHNILFQAMVNAVIPYDNDEKVNATEERKSATRRIYQELVKREIKIQGDILALYPLVKSVCSLRRFNST